MCVFWDGDGVGGDDIISRPVSKATNHPGYMNVFLNILKGFIRSMKKKKKHFEQSIK
jgi:hypothetical protein